MIKWFKIIMIAGVILGFFSQCNIFETDNTSGSVLLIESLTNEEGETPLFSNVSNLSNTLCEANLTAMLINPDVEEGTYYQSIIVDQIDVEYSRSDGLSQEGKDIPFAFSQNVNWLIAIGETLDFGFTIVQHTAKLEPPLVDLEYVDNYYNEEKILKLEAKVTFHGKDVGGHRIEPAVGYVSIWCADFGEEEEE